MDVRAIQHKLCKRGRDSKLFLLVSVGIDFGSEGSREKNHCLVNCH